MEIRKIKDLLKCELLTEALDTDINIQYAYASDLMSDILSSANPGALLLTGLTNVQAIRTCQIAGIKAVIFVRNKRPDTVTIELAKQCKIPTLVTGLSMFDASGILYSNGIKGIKIKR